jgi:hypothetical protein
MRANPIQAAAAKGLDTPLKQAAHAAGMSVSWLHSVVRRRIVHSQMIGRTIYVNLDEVKRYVKWMRSMSKAERSAIRYPEAGDGTKEWPVEPASY